jgi:PAS domain S-box-containing protein
MTREIHLFVIGLSIVFQVSAAVLAFQCIMMRGRRLVGFLIAVTMLMMAFRLTLSLHGLVTGGAEKIDPIAEITACLISLLLLLGIYYLGRLLVSLQKEIGARARAENTLKEVNAKLQTLLRAMPDAVFFKDSERRYLLVNKTFEEQAGTDQGRIIGRTDWELMPPDAAERLKKNEDELIESRNPCRVEDAITSAAGELRYVDVIKAPIYDSRGRFLGIVGVSRDITERKRSEEELEKHRKHLEELVFMHTRELRREMEERRRAEEELALQYSLLKAQAESSHDGLLVVDKEDRIILHNKRFAEIWRIPDAILGRKSDEGALDYIQAQLIKTDEFVQRVKALHESREATGEEVIESTEGRFFERYSAPVIDSDGRYHGRIWYFRDITQKKRAEVALRSHAGQMQALSSRLMDISEQERRFIAQELHDEIGQALTGMKLTLDLMMHSATGAAAEELRSLQLLSGELLVKVRNLSLDLRPSMLDDLGLLAALEWNFKRYSGRTGIRVVFNHDLSRTRLPSNVETVVYRVTQEALTNVARHAGVGEAGVLIEENEGVLIVTIEDNGQGFEAETMSANRQSLGLIGMRERIESVNGRLDVSSSPGKGTLLTAMIPLSEYY